LTTGILDEDEDAEERFAGLPDEEHCPALDPATLTCDLYQSRPVTCRIFGPAVRSGGDVLGVCELNYHGATDEQIAACQVHVDPDGLEDKLLEGLSGQTIVAFAAGETAGETACATTGKSFACIGGAGFSLPLEFVHFSGGGSGVVSPVGGI
jgi:hypothetical protein